MSKIPNGNFDQLIWEKKAELLKVNIHKAMIEYIDLIFLKNSMMVDATAEDLKATRDIMDVPILADLERLKKTIYGNDEDTDEKTGCLNKVNKMFNDWKFTKRLQNILWTIFGSSIIGIITTVVIIITKLIDKGW
jgi:hypothetical protein